MRRVIARVGKPYVPPAVEKKEEPTAVKPDLLESIYDRELLTLDQMYQRMAAEGSARDVHEAAAMVSAARSAQVLGPAVEQMQRVIMERITASFHELGLSQLLDGSTPELNDAINNNLSELAARVSRTVQEREDPAAERTELLETRDPIDHNAYSGNDTYREFRQRENARVCRPGQGPYQTLRGGRR